ncbi:MAG TPA: multiheme c-type cytochrome [Polyangiaceae bacterium]|nr:multiheme c-type cytochrome [Polyangiaceae bacterium]
MSPRRPRRGAAAYGGVALFAALLAARGASAECLFPSGGTPPAAIDPNLFTTPNPGCRKCHQKGDDQAPVSFRAYTTWAGTMMANSLRDPLFLAALAVAEQDVPAPAQCENPAEPPVGLGQWCVRCHSPAAFVAGTTSPLDETKWTTRELQGVGCDVCHLSTVDEAVPGVPAEAPFIGNAQIYFDPSGVRRGPYENIESSGHSGVLDPFTSSSELCGQCHQVSNPLVTLKDAAGVDTGKPFPLDTTYDEWKDSVFSNEQAAEKKSCVDCHMPRIEGNYVVGTGSDGVDPLRPNPPRHLFAGGNRWGIDAVAHADPAYAGAVDNVEAFELARAAAEEMLRASAAIEAPVAPAGPVAAGAQVAFGARVKNRSGHKFPTGYADGRRAFVQVGFRDRTGREIVLSGRYEDDDLVAEGDAQLRVYEAVHASSEGAAAEGHLAKHDLVVKDSRIPPAGFTGAVDTTRPVGVTWYDAPGGGYRDYDEVAYSFTLPSAFTDGPGQAFIRVVYQATTKHYIELLEQANAGKNQRGQKLREAWEATGKAAPFVVAEATTDVVLSGGTLPPPGAGGSGGVAGAGGSGATGGAPGGGQGGAGPSNPSDPAARVEGGGCACALGPRDRDARGALVAASLVALALGASRRRRR